MVRLSAAVCDINTWSGTQETGRPAVKRSSKTGFNRVSSAGLVRLMGAGYYVLLLGFRLGDTQGGIQQVG